MNLAGELRARPRLWGGILLHGAAAAVLLPTAPAVAAAVAAVLGGLLRSRERGPWPAVAVAAALVLGPGGVALASPRWLPLLATLLWTLLDLALLATVLAGPRRQPAPVGWGVALRVVLVVVATLAVLGFLAVVPATAGLLLPPRFPFTASLVLAAAGALLATALPAEDDEATSP